MNNETQLFDEINLLTKKINKFSFLNKKGHFDEVNIFCQNFIAIYNAEKQKLPYHINILDLIWANENAHNRIFTKLLKQKNDTKYEILSKFVTYLKKMNPNFDLILENPRISSEKDRIDILILDKKFALIIENKIHNALDQNAQLARYIEKIKNRGYSEKSIYLIYLTRNGNKKPVNHTWVLNNVDYKIIFQDRYIEISFKKDILPWLKGNVLPNCRVKDVYLKSSIEQYIDYLEGLFNKREMHKDMNDKLKKHIKEVLGLNSSGEDSIKKLEKKLDDIIKVEDQIRTLIDEYYHEYWSKWVIVLKKEFPNYKLLDFSVQKEYKKVGVQMSFNNYVFSILIEFNSNDKLVYYGISRHHCSDELFGDVSDLVKPLVEGFMQNDWWYGYEYTSFENAYVRIKSLINSVELEKEKGA